MTDRVTYQTVTVENTNTTSSTFDARTGDGTLVQGIVSNSKNLPSVGQSVTIWLQGATVLYQPEGIATASVGNTEISAVGGSKLSSDTVTANLTLASQILTATAGQRAGITPIGLQAWDASNNLTVSLTGVSNLLTGTTQTAATGRRIVSGAAGTTGRLAFIAPDGTETEVISYAESGTESIRLGNAIDDTWAGWNAVTAQGNEIIRIASGQQVHYFGGDTSSGSKQWSILQATNSGSPGTQPSSITRAKIDTTRTTHYAPDNNTQHEITNDTHRFWVGATASDGSVDIIPHGLADANTRSPRIQLRGEGGTSAGNLKFVIAGGVARVECTNTADAYGEFRCSAVVQTSSAQFKTDIADAASVMPIVRGAKARKFRLVSKAGKIRDDDGEEIDIPEQIGPLEVGIVAEEAPPELVTGDGEGINVGRTAIVALLAVKELEARVAALEAKVKP